MSKQPAQYEYFHRMRCSQCTATYRERQPGLLCPGCRSDQYDFANARIPLYACCQFEDEYRTDFISRCAAMPATAGFARMMRIDYWAKRGEEARLARTKPDIFRNGSGWEASDA